MIDFVKFPLWINSAVFTAAAILVWSAGTRLTHLTDAIAERTGLGEAFAGVVLLGTATSLPEIATTGTAAVTGNPVLAGNNLLGGIAMQIAVLALIDGVALRGKALTFFSPRPELLMEGVMLIMLIAFALAAVAVGDIAIFGHFGAWPVAIAALYVTALLVIYRYQGQPRWKPSGELAEPPQSAVDMKDIQEERYAEWSLARLGSVFAGLGLLVLVGGFLVAESAAALAQQTGLGASFIGATLLALATSLPEISTTFTAVRIGAYSMAIGNIFGTNALEVALFLPADALHTDGPIMTTLDRSAILLGVLGILGTAFYLWGILERRDRTIFGMGFDSAAVLSLYASGMALLYGIRN